MEFLGPQKTLSLSNQKVHVIHEEEMGLRGGKSLLQKIKLQKIKLLLLQFLYHLQPKKGWVGTTASTEQASND